MQEYQQTYFVLQTVHVRYMLLYSAHNYRRQKAIATDNAAEDEIIGSNYFERVFPYYSAYCATAKIAADNATKLEIIGSKFLPVNLSKL